MTTAVWTDEIAAAQAGDRGALERVLTRSRQDLRRYAEYHCEINDMEDAVQESLYTVSRRIANLRQLESFASWLFRIVKRECNRMKRVVRGLRQEPITEDIEGPNYPDAPLLSRDVVRALQKLPAHYRQILLLRDLEGLTLNEIAEQLQLTLLATKARLHRARALAREYLEP